MCVVTDGSECWSSSLDVYLLSVWPDCAPRLCLKHLSREAFCLDWKKKTVKQKKERDKEERKMGVLCVQHRPQIMAPFLRAGHEHSTGTFCPPLHLKWAAPGKQHKDIHQTERERLKRADRGCVCVLWPNSATSISSTLTRHIINDATARLRKHQIRKIWLNWRVDWGGFVVVLHAEHEALGGLWGGRLCCVSFIRGITATSLICWSPTATGCPALIAWHAKCDSPDQSHNKKSLRMLHACRF